MHPLLAQTVLMMFYLTLCILMGIIVGKQLERRSTLGSSFFADPTTDKKITATLAFTITIVLMAVIAMITYRFMTTGDMKALEFASGIWLIVGPILGYVLGRYFA